MTVDLYSLDLYKVDRSMSILGLSDWSKLIKLYLYRDVGIELDDRHPPLKRLHKTMALHRPLKINI